MYIYMYIYMYERHSKTILVQRPCVRASTPEGPIPREVMQYMCICVYVYICIYIYVYIYIYI